MYTPPHTPAYAEVLLAEYDENSPLAEQVNKKLSLLDMLSEDFFADDVPYLLPCLCDASPQVRNTVMRLITGIVGELESRRAFQRASRHIRLQPEMLDALEKQFKNGDRLTILALASFSRSGYTRQRAVALLGEYDAFDSLPYLLWRVGDCVPQVSREAIAAVTSLLEELNVGCFLRNIELVQRLYNSARADGVRLYLSIASLLLGTSPDVLIDMVKDDTRRRRLLLQFFGQFRVHQDWVKECILDDSEYSVRSLVFQLPSWYEDFKIQQLAFSLSVDPHPGIRYAALAEYGKGLFMDRTMIRFHLADPSRAVRRLARQLASEEDLQIVGFFAPIITLHDFGLKRYNKLACRLLSISEIPSFRSEAIALIAENILHEDPAVQYAALRGMDLLSMPEANRFALHHLGSPRRILRHRAAKILACSASQEYIAQTRRHFSNAPTSTKLGALKLYSLVGGQQAREDLVSALKDSNNVVRSAALRYLVSRYGFKPSGYPGPEWQPESIDRAWRKHLGALGDWTRELTNNRSIDLDALFPSVHEKLPWRGTQAEFISYVLEFTGIGAFGNEKVKVGPDDIGNIMVKVYDVDLSPYPNFASMRMAVPPGTDPVKAQNKAREGMENIKNVQNALKESGIAPSRESQLEAVAVLAWVLDFRRRLSPYIDFPLDEDGDFL